MERGGHRGLDEAGVDGVGAYLVLGVLDGGRLGEEAHRRLGGEVRRMAHVADYRVGGGDVDYGAAAGPAHSGDGVFRAEERPGGVHLHDLVPALKLRVLDRLPLRYAGVVHQDVELAVSLLYEVDGPLPLVLLCNVQVDGERFPARSPDLGGHPFCLLVRYVGQGDLRALTGEEAGDLGSYAAGGARYQGDLSFQSHRTSS